jgi:hypothetical protein
LRVVIFVQSLHAAPVRGRRLGDRYQFKPDGAECGLNRGDPSFDFRAQRDRRIYFLKQPNQAANHHGTHHGSRGHR